MSETTSFFAGCATAGVAIIFLVGGRLTESNESTVVQPLVPSAPAQGPVVAQLPDSASVYGSAPLRDLSSERDLRVFMEEIREQRTITEDLYGRLDEQQELTEQLEEQLEEQGLGLQEQQDNAEQIVGLFEEQRSQTEQIVGLFEEQRSHTDQIAAMVEEQQGLIQNINHSSGESAGQLAANRFQGFSIPLLIAVSTAVVVITALVGIAILLIIAVIVQSRNRTARTIHREYHMPPPRLSLPERGGSVQHYPVQNYPTAEVYPEVVSYRPVGRYVRRIDPIDQVPNVSHRVR